MRYLPLLLLLCASQVFGSIESISLARYLTLANEQGHGIVFSEALVLPRHRLTYDPDQRITLAAIRKALAAFNLSLKEGDINVVVARTQTRITAAEDLELAAPAIEEIVVSSSLHEFRMNQITPTTYLDREDLARRANVANDVVRVASRLPGNATNGVSSRTAIRGGRVNETLITFDGFRLYEPFHLHHFQDLFSVFDDRTIDNIQFITGGFPVNLGDRMSGVMQISTLPPGDIGEPIHEAGLGLYQASWLQSGTLLKQPFIFSLRRSTIDLIGRSVKSDLGTPAFSDLMFRMDSDLGDTTTLSTNLLWFGDDLDINNSSGSEQTQTSYGNTYLWFTLRQDPDEDRSHRTRLGFAAIKDDREGSIGKQGIVNGFVQDDQEFRVYTLEHEYQRNWQSTSLIVGGSYRYLDAEYALDQELDIDPAFAGISNYERPTTSHIGLTEYGQQLAFWMSARRALTESLYIEAGVRLDAQDYLEDGGWHSEVSPRLSVLYRIAGGDLRLSWGSFDQAQGIHELEISDGVTSFQDPQQSEHTIASFARSFGTTDLRIEAYHKKVDRPAFYFENLADPVSLIPELQADRVLVAPDEVEAKGIELSLHVNLENSDLWFNYTRADVRERFGSRRVRRGNDQKHAANIGWAMAFDDWRLAIEATYHSGWPTSTIRLDALGNTEPVTRHDRRLPNYASVDLKASREWQFRRGNLRLEMGVTNLLNRENQVGTDYDLVEDDASEEAVIFDASYALPIAPFIDVYWRF